MAVAEIIGAAIGVLLLVVVAYLLVGGTLTTAETVTAAQKDITLLHESRLGTKIEISNIMQPSGGILNFTVSNNGTAAITDLQHMDIMLFTPSNGYLSCQYVTNTAVPQESLNPSSLGDYQWTDTVYLKDDIHARQLDPGASMRVEVKYPADTEKPLNVQVTTSNGISAVSGI